MATAAEDLTLSRLIQCREAIAYLTRAGVASTSGVAKQMGLSTTQAHLWIRRLIEAGQAERNGYNSLRLVKGAKR